MLRVVHRGALALSLAALAPLAAQAQQEVAAPVRLREEVSLDVEDASVSEIAAEIARQSGRTVLVDGDADARIALRLERVSWRDAADLVARLAHLRLRELPGEVLLIERPLRVSVTFTDADVRTVLLLLARYAGQSIVIAPEVRGRITVDLKDVEPLTAIRAIAATAGDYVVLGGAVSVRVGAPGAGAGAPPRPAASPPVGRRTVDGRFRGLAEDALRIELSDGRAREVPLSTSPALRSRLRAALAQLREGDRLLLTVERARERWIVADLIAPDRGR